MIFKKRAEARNSKNTILNNIDIPPTAVLFLVILFLGGVVYGIFMKMILSQPWIVSVPNLVTTGITIAFTALVIADRLSFWTLLHTVCSSACAIFIADGAWWFFANQPNALLVINVSIGYITLFCFLLIMIGNPWTGFAIMTISLLLYSIESALMNHRYPLTFLGLCLPSAIAFSIALFMLRRALEKKLSQKKIAPQDRPVLDLAAKKLSEVEIRCLDYLMADMSRKEMAERESVSISAIHNRFSILFRKLNVIDQQHLRELLRNHDVHW